MFCSNRKPGSGLSHYIQVGVSLPVCFDQFDMERSTNIVFPVSTIFEIVVTLASQWPREMREKTLVRLSRVAGEAVGAIYIRTMTPGTPEYVGEGHQVCGMRFALSGLLWSG